MKKKGFTLVELLAVIAILAILVIIALPNVMSLFNEAKKNSFNNELKEIFKTAQNQWMTDSMINTAEQYYSRVDGGSTTLKCDGSTNNKTLQLSGRQQLDYGIIVNKSGEVTDFMATDGTYFYHFVNASAPLKIEAIGNGTAATDLKASTNYIISLSEANQTKATIGCTSKAYTVTWN